VVVKVESLDDLVRATFELTPEALAEAEFEVDDAALVDIYAGLFTNPEFLLGRYSHDQLDAGFAAMINCDNDLAVSELVWNRGVPIEKREHLISSMEHLYERFFRRESFVYSTFMWWDALAYAFECGNAVRGRSDERACGDCGAACEQAAACERCHEDASVMSASLGPVTGL